MECTGRGLVAGFSLTARRNDSLSAAGRHLVFCLILAVSLAISVGFALVGAWPILPFAGAEMLALYLAFRYVARHAGDYERITVDGDRVLLEAADGDRVARHEFNRYWVQVVLDWAGSDGHCRLALRYCGKEVEFGRHLTDEEREAAARRLRQTIKDHRP